MRKRMSRRRDVLMHADGRKYLSRWFFFNKHKHPSTPRVHLFHSSDEEVPHDHPSDFFAVALWGWAWEWLYAWDDGNLVFRRKRLVLPFIPRITRAETIHRIVDPKNLLTVVVFKRYKRQWGFWPLVDGKRKWLSNIHFRREEGGERM